MSTASAPSNNAALSRLLDEASRGAVTDAEFLSQAKELGVSSAWVQAQLERLHTDWDESRLCLLIDCLYLPGVHGAAGWASVTSAFCRLMLDPRMEPGTVELTADAIADFRLDLQDLRVLTLVCTSSRWNDDGYWPDLRKALETMPAAVHNGAVSRREVLDLLSTVANSPATQTEDCGLRSTAQAMSRQISEEAE
ncbi:hypothetical protein [Aquabacterium sp. OR-4]|uniref:hypothetical protein n=1 Tax=Aquabacterium sp. OR-4 TaxID=2978127 RepID=UPI0021B2B813|nr:hypothetical protein [Aquabacterium sp. OR-4]MDT7836061.1 hypothetical protein [Aquabacterium sp. OR-4]MDT7839100.1 hypothetical protein [Aquabacterium sp. OR-4]